MLLRRGIAATAAGGTAAAAFGYYKARTTMGEDALSRMMSYNVVAVPAILQYKAVEARYEKAPKLLPALFSEISEDELTRRYEALHHTHARPLFDKFMELGGFYYKTGQKVATNLGRMSPKIYVDFFQPFLDHIPPRDFASVRRVIEEELGRPMGEVFASFDEAPLGCASIGQVHRATLRATGERVVVKVQNPEAERTFRGDVFALKVLVDAFAPQISVAFDEIAKQVACRLATGPLRLAASSAQACCSHVWPWYWRSLPPSLTTGARQGRSAPAQRALCPTSQARSSSRCPSTRHIRMRGLRTVDGASAHAR